jgi:hypothetical protein
VKKETKRNGGNGGGVFLFEKRNRKTFMENGFFGWLPLNFIGWVYLLGTLDATGTCRCGHKAFGLDVM